MQGTQSAPHCCPNCNRTLELVATISRLGQQPETRFFECKICGGLEILEYGSALHHVGSPPRVNLSQPVRRV